MLTIYSDGHIAYSDGSDTGLRVDQMSNHTRVIIRATGEEVVLPCTRYALAIRAQRDAFIKHVMAILKRTNYATN